MVLVDGNWICGFTKYLGACSASLAKLWGFFDGLNMAWMRVFRAVELCIDSVAVVKSMKGGKSSSEVGIHSLLEMEWEIKICHFYWEGNCCADALANMSCDSEDALGLELCPSLISHLIFVDVIGVSTPCLLVLWFSFLGFWPSLYKKRTTRCTKAPAYAGSGKGSHHFWCIVRSLTLFFTQEVVSRTWTHSLYKKEKKTCFQFLQ